MSDKKHLLYNNQQKDDELRILHRNIIMKHASFLNNGSQTVRNNDIKDEKIFNDSSSDTGAGKLIFF